MFVYVLRALSFLFALLYALVSLHACSQQETEALAIPENTSDEIIEGDNAVNILQSRGEISLYLQQAIDLYMQSDANNGIAIHVQTVGNASDYQVALRSKLLAGEKVDAFHVFGHRDAGELSPYLMNLNSLQWINTALEGTLDAVTFDGEVFGIPYSVEGLGLIANRNIFEAAGIPLSDIQTFEDLTEAFFDLQEQIDEGLLEEGFPNLEAVTEFPALDNRYLSEQISNVILTNQFISATEAYRAESISFSHADAAEEWIRLMARYSSSSSWGLLNEVPRTEQVENGLANQRIAVVLESTSVYPSIVNINSELQNRLSFLPVPLEGIETASVYWEVPAYWAINATSDPAVQDAAKNFFTWLYQTDAGTSVVAGRFQAASAYRDQAKETENRMHSQLIGYMQADTALPQVNREFPGDWGSDVLAPSLRRYLSAEMEWEDLVEYCEEQWVFRR